MSAAPAYFSPGFNPWAAVAAKLEGGSFNARDAQTPGQLAQILDPRTVQTPALELIDSQLVRVAEGDIQRLIISMPPQEGKSQRASHYFPTWLLIQNPDLRIGVASYEHGIARRWGRAVRNTIASHPELGLKVRNDTSAAHEWQLENHDGGLYSVGLGGALTGRPLDCVSADTHILTDRGLLTAADAYRTGISRILAYDHETSRAVWRTVEASRRIPSRRVLTIRTQSGRSITCTPDHRICTSRGYVPAGSLRGGETLVGLVASFDMPVRHAPRDPEDGSTQGDTPQPDALLLAGMHGNGFQGTEPDPVLRLRRVHTAEQEGLLLGRVLAGVSAISSTEDLRTLRSSLQASIVAGPILQPTVREPRALPPDDWAGQLALQNGNELRALLPLDTTADPGTRRTPVRSLHPQPHGDISAGREDSNPVRPSDPSHRRGRHEQHTPEPDRPLFELSYNAPQVEADTVAMVRSGGDSTVDVYDFQVEGTRNFFAGGVLVHNCLLIDDPVKDRAQAESLAYRDAAWNWWTDVARTRFAPGAFCVLIQTRWHEDDLAGRLIGQDTEDWQVVNIPALADHRPDKGETDPLGREPGQWMESARGRTVEQWEKIREAVGARTFAALYQGRPAPVEGDLLKRDHWQRYDISKALPQDDGTWRAVGADEVIQSWDFTFKDTKGSDYVVGQVWARYGLDAYLLAQVRGRMSFTATLAEVKRLTREWPQTRLKLVEEKANGAAIIDMLKSEVTGLVPVVPKESKYARAVAVSPFIESRHVFIPSDTHASWAAGFVEECVAFPNSQHDDQVDAMTQALDRLLGHPVSVSIRRPPRQVQVPSGFGAAMGGYQHRGIGR